MKKIAIVTGYHIKNYGSALQAFATQKILDDNNIENECIHYEKKNTLSQVLRVFNKPLLKAKLATIKKQIYAKKNYETFGKYLKIRNEKFDEFVKTNFRVSKTYNGYQELVEGTKNYKAFLLGSDQVWNPMNFGSHFYTLEFVPDNITKIAYAPSFGVSTIPKHQIEQTKKYLSRIEYISVREKKGQELIKELIGRDVPIVVDPTLLLTLQQWQTIYPQERIVKEKYIFCYFLGTNPSHREFANKLKEQTGFKIITLPHMDEIVEGDFKFGESLYDIGPVEFLNLIANAEYVCTDSFHGTVFSILHHKKFFTFSRYKETKKDSTNSRLTSLLGILGIEDRLYTAKENPATEIKKEINYSKVDEKLEDMRKDSINYLMNAISNIKIQ